MKLTTTAAFKNILNMGKVAAIHTVSKIEVNQTPFWRNVPLLALAHFLSIVATYLLSTGEVRWQTLLFSIFTLYLSLMGFTAGVHRLWSHRAYKAKTPLKIILAFAQLISYQDSVIIWARDHRLHHKHTDTDADPHNSKRGILFSHIGWLIVPKNNEVMSNLREIDISDLETDPILMFQHKYYWHVLLPLGMILFISIPVTFWDESILPSIALAHLRIVMGWHFTFLTNSAAHMWGYKPYDKSIQPVDNKVVSILTAGEGWHNYHHTFPWDYKTSEYGFFNFTTVFIDFFAAIGWAYDLKSVPQSAVEMRAARTGDGSWSPKELNGYHIHANNPWGWGDKIIPEEDKKITQIICFEERKTS